MSENKRHKTAITRSNPSKPMQILDKKGLIKTGGLDYGSGKGFDADYFSLDKFDPHFQPVKPTKTYDLITCNYVLNVIPDKQERESVLEDICQLLTENGKAFVAVRRDIKSDTKTQFKVDLSLPVVYEDKSVCIYELNKNNLSWVKTEVQHG
jgi:hypothetical protein